MPVDQDRKSQVVGSGEVTIEITVTPPALSRSYLGVARGLLEGVFPLAEVQPLPAWALCFLCAQVLECGLKAYLSRDGRETHLMKPDIRHDLEKLWAQAWSEGLSLSANPPAWVIDLSNLHRHPYYLRYTKGINGLVLPAPRPMINELSALIDLLQEKL